MGDTQTDPECDQAGAAAQAPYDQQMVDLKNTWSNRDGFFYLKDAKAILQAGLDLQKQGQAILDSIGAKYGDTLSPSAKQGRDWAQSAIFKVGSVATEFLAATNAATIQGATIIDATGLKDWTIDAISAAGGAAYLGGYFDCSLYNVSAYLGPLSVLIGASNALVAVAKGAAKVTLAAGETIYKTAVNTLDFAATAIKYAPMIAIGLGALWVVKKYARR
jgi:hypothetical protein